MNPLVTVLMSVYNGQKYIGEALDSILQQTYKNIEIIVFNDASSDGSAAIIEGFAEKDARIVFVNNLDNCGLTKNLQRGVIMATGKYIARMDADDIAMPERISTQVDYLESHPEIDILGTSYIPFVDNEYGTEVKQITGHEDICCELLLQFTLVHPTVMMRRERLIENNLNYDPEFRYSQDFDLWERASRKLTLENLNIPLLKLRGDHPGKISTRLKKPQKECSDRVRRRQLEKLCVNLSENEEAVFHAFGSHALEMTFAEMQTLDEVLMKIVKANRVASIYNQEKLEKRAAELFRWNCLACYEVDRAAAVYYYKSHMRILDKIPLKIWIYMAAKRMGIVR